MTFIAPHYSKAKKSTTLNFFKKDHYLVKTPWWLKKLYPGCLWDMQVKDKTLYLTFDDGPHPTITTFILSELKKYNAKATFFCIGENVARYPDLYQKMIDDGHAVGNHTQYHVNGWNTRVEDYLRDIREARQFINSRLFRPPYGRMKREQMKQLMTGEDKMAIVMWNILAGDWDASVSPEKCYARIKNKITAGDIIVLHDSDKAWDRMSHILPRLLEDFSKSGFHFGKISV
ncbi:MAG TPA: polysaccharide deacetylase family protein [Chitinophagaceae bacterium]|nr:polysaccharide deacetylase family protein [Chitinophagaceae bacterium]